MQYTSVIPYFVIMISLLVLAGIFAKRLPFFTKELKEAQPGRYEVLDGLRGILALGVFFQHAVTNWEYFRTGTWEMTEVHFYRFIGGESVILFFIITSFLYWSKAIARKGNIHMPTLYRNRLLRLAPMYLFCVVIIIFLAFLRDGVIIKSVIGFLKELLSWLTLGIITTVTVNDNTIIPINAGIHWTLHFEWIFYLVLPVAAMALRGKWMALWSVPILAITLLAPDRGYWMIFLFGIVAAHIVHLLPTQRWLTKRMAALIPLAGIFAVYVIQDRPYSLPQYAVTMLVFLCFVYGNDLWGLLKTGAAKLLGMISYSVYLLHGIILYMVLHSVDAVYPIATLSPVAYWFVILIAGILTICAATLTFQHIEYPFLKKIHHQPPKK